ncbi:MAG: succinate dehydrogenase, cytochrome b556 subunit [Pseudomonadota bacterium]|nr:succinate dehydrogenase, cytochrome b556 subunit [Pseudomonadota bacterium]
MSNDNRPLSPHLGIYRPQISSVLSILHRATGIALSAGLILLAGWLWSAAYAPASFAYLHTQLETPIGQFCLMGWVASFYYHLGNGVRHLFWDIGQGFTIPVMTRSGWLVVLFTIAMTAGTWGFVYAAARY